MVAGSKREAIKKVLRRVHNIRPKTKGGAAKRPTANETSFDLTQLEASPASRRNTRTSIQIGVPTTGFTTGIVTDRGEAAKLINLRSSAFRRAEIARRRGFQPEFVPVPYKLSRPVRPRKRDSPELPVPTLDGPQLKEFVGSIERNMQPSPAPKPLIRKRKAAFTEEGIETEWSPKQPKPSPVPRPTPPLQPPLAPRPGLSPNIPQVERGIADPPPPEPPLDTRFNKIPTGENKLDAFLNKITNPIFIKQNLQALLSTNVQRMSPIATMQPLRTITDDSRATVRAIF